MSAVSSGAYWYSRILLLPSQQPTSETTTLKRKSRTPRPNDPSAIKKADWRLHIVPY
ncbi:hypothetical protein SAMN05216525_12522 [Bradyrhizobium sp. Gha]|nr:hypothetical protein SAMN05216525_12522 [Bradyrhizobium sp. Gha]